MRNLRLPLFALIWAALSGGQAFAQGKPTPAPKPNFDSSLTVKAEQPNASPNERMKVIVKYKGTAAGARTKLNGRVERIKREHRSIGAMSAEVRRARLAEVCSLKDISCSDDAKVRTKSEQDPVTVTADPLIDEPWIYEPWIYEPTTTTLAASTTTTSTTTALSSLFDSQKLRATLGLRSSWKGAGVGIAVIDSGIAPTWDLYNRVTHFRDFTNGGIVAPLSDGYGHGTHIAGLIAGNGRLSLGKYVGIAPSARLIGLKVLDAQGSGYTSDVIAALEFAVANRVALGIDIINLSLGHPVFERPETDPLVHAVQNAVAAGIVVVVSAGNWGLNNAGEIGYAGITSPGNAAAALTVGAMRTKATASRSDDEVSLFSSRGPTWYDGRVKPDVVAPGQALVAINSLTSTLFQNPLLHVDISPYIKLSGTSMSAAVTSGVVALMIEANRLDEGAASRLTPNTVKAILQYTALAVPETFSPNGIPAALAQGAGGINGAGAIELTRAIDPGAPIHSPWLETAIHPFTTIAGTTHQWAQGIVWGNHIVSSDTVTWHLPLWALSIVWGHDDGVVWGDDGVVWGDAFHGPNLPGLSFAQWSTQIAWGHAIVWGQAIVRGADDGVVWGDLNPDGIVWGDDDDGVVWGDDDGIVWGDSFFSFLED